MMAGYFFRGLLIGLVFGVPAGAIGALAIQRTLDKGFLAGLVTGAGSSAADVLYACVGIFGITAISDFLTEHLAVIRLVGGIFILVLAMTVLGKKEQVFAPQETKRGKPVFLFLSAFTAAIFNPATVLSFMVVFTAFGIDDRLGIGKGIALLSGILMGTLCWWGTLSGIVVHFRGKVTASIYTWLNRILGCLMILFGITMMIWQK